METPANPENKAHPVLPARTGSQERQATKETTQRSRSAAKATADRQDLRARKDPKETRAKMARQERRDHPDHQVHPDSRELRAVTEMRAAKAQPASQARMRSTVHVQTARMPAAREAREVLEAAAQELAVLVIMALTLVAARPAATDAASSRRAFLV